MLRMTKLSRCFVGALLVVGPGLVALAQVAPPPETVTPAAPSPAATRTAPATTTPASTLPSAQSVLENLLNERPAAPVAGTATTTPANPALTPAVEASAPNEPKVNRIPEGRMLWNRIGRLSKDDKTGTFVFTFDADGQKMADPPIAVLPSHLLMSMEEASDKGTKPVKFKITGEVTEYRGKNFLYIKNMQAVRDMNQGIGG
jgi:hypothetical protein